MLIPPDGRLSTLSGPSDLPESCRTKPWKLAFNTATEVPRGCSLIKNGPAVGYSY